MRNICLKLINFLRLPASETVNWGGMESWNTIINHSLDLSFNLRAVFGEGPQPKDANDSETRPIFNEAFLYNQATKANFLQLSILVLFALSLSSACFSIIHHYHLPGLGLRHNVGKTTWRSDSRRWCRHGSWIGSRDAGTLLQAAETICRNDYDVGRRCRRGAVLCDTEGRSWVSTLEVYPEGVCCEREYQ